MSAPAEIQYYDIEVGLCLDVVSTSSANNAQVYNDSPDEEQPENILSLFRSRLPILLDLIVSTLSNKGVLNLALTECGMYTALLPVLEKRRADFWTFLRTPRNNPGTDLVRGIAGRDKPLEAALSYMSEMGVICVTGCCTPPLTEGGNCQRLLRRHKKTLRLGEKVVIYFRGPMIVYLQVVESKTCKQHPVQLGTYAII